MNLSGKRVIVMGLGRFGGGAGAARFCAQRGANVLVTDLAGRDQLAQSLTQLQDLPIEYRLGEHRECDFTTADLIVVNPAINPRNNPYLHAAARARIPTTSEIRLLVAHLPDRRRTIGVTGTAGKSTVVAMIGHILRQAVGPDRVHVGSNIGGSLLDKLPAIQNDHWIVLELSSFMLDSLDQDAWSPGTAVVTNFAPNHLDWHGRVEDYTTA
ncbi:MAG: Mur ligase family protein, partial [Phycisphaeraceae bacterium]